MTGGKDVQVDPADVAAIGRMVTGPFEGETPDDLTHVLRRDHSPGLHRYVDNCANPLTLTSSSASPGGRGRSCRDRKHLASTAEPAGGDWRWRQARWRQAVARCGVSGSVSGGEWRAAPGEMPTVRLKARLNAASDS